MRSGLIAQGVFVLTFAYSNGAVADVPLETEEDVRGEQVNFPGCSACETLHTALLSNGQTINECLPNYCDDNPPLNPYDPCTESRCSLQRGCIELRPRKNCPGASGPNDPKNSCENLEEVSCDLPADSDRCRALVLDFVSGTTSSPVERDSYFYFRKLTKRLKVEKGCKTYYYNHNDAAWKYLCERVDRLWTLSLPMDDGIIDVEWRCEILEQSGLFPAGFCQDLIPLLENEPLYDVEPTLVEMANDCLASDGRWGTKLSATSNPFVWDLAWKLSGYHFSQNLGRQVLREVFRNARRLRADMIGSALQLKPTNTLFTVVSSHGSDAPNVLGQRGPSTPLSHLYGHWSHSPFDYISEVTPYQFFSGGLGHELNNLIRVNLGRYELYSRVKILGTINGGLGICNNYTWDFSCNSGESIEAIKAANGPSCKDRSAGLSVQGYSLSACDQVGYATQIRDGLGYSVSRFLHDYNFPDAAPKRFPECPWLDEMEIPGSGSLPSVLVQPQSVVLEGHLLCQED